MGTGSRQLGRSDNTSKILCTRRKNWQHNHLKTLGLVSRESQVLPRAASLPKRVQRRGFWINLALWPGDPNR